MQISTLQSTGLEDQKFLCLVQDNFLTQHVLEPTRATRIYNPASMCLQNAVISNVYIAFCKQMEAGFYLSVYRRCFRGGNSIFSLWSLSRFVTKLFTYRLE